MPKEKTTRKGGKERVQRRKKGKLLSISSGAIDASNARVNTNYHPDPNAPKRGLSAYMFFANDNRDKVREENPGITFGKYSRSLS